MPAANVALRCLLLLVLAPWQVKCCAHKLLISCFGVCPPNFESRRDTTQNPIFHLTLNIHSKVIIVCGGDTVLRSVCQW